MNISRHIRVTWTLRVEMSVAGRSDLRRVIGVPRDSPSYWAVEAYRLSLGIEPEGPWDEDVDESVPLIDLDPWRREPQRVSIAGIADAIEVIVTGPFEARMGEPRVTIIEAGSAMANDENASLGWQVRRPTYRGEHVALELAQRYGLVQPLFDSSLAEGLDTGLQASAQLASLCESLTPVRRLAFLAHIEASGVLDTATPDPAVMASATASLREFIAQLGTDGVPQDGMQGWVPRAFATTVAGTLGWPAAAPPDLPDPADALVMLARRTKAIRRFRGRIVATNVGRALAAGELAAFPRIVEVVKDNGKTGLFSSGHSRSITLALLAVADGSAATFDQIPELVALGETAVEGSRHEPCRTLEWSPRSMGDARRKLKPEDRSTARRVVEDLCAVSLPERFGVITPAMRVIASAALR